ncbi:MAG: tRNA lysidine(34) synthetase TilS [Nitrospirales bacterium]
MPRGSARRLPPGPASLSRRVAAFARTRHLWVPGDRVLVAVSGGPDSVALLSMLQGLAPSEPLTLGAVHVNHGLRGEESDADAAFVAALCARWGIELTCERLSPEDLLSSSKGRSLQEVARDARYRVLERTAIAQGAQRIALGHTADDQAETLVMWMLRGAGPRGLSGMPAARRPWLIRPLLPITREEVLAYLETCGLNYRTDSSNLKPTYLRNRIRQEVLPALKRFNPSLLKTLGRQADILREEDRCLEAWTDRELARLAQPQHSDLLLDREEFLTLPLAIQRRAVRTLVTRMSGLVRGPGFAAVSGVLSRVVRGASGSRRLVGDVEFIREYDRLRVTRERGTDRPTRRSVTVPVPSTVRWPLGTHAIQTLAVRVVPRDKPVPDPMPAPSNTCALIDADRLGAPLRLRTWEPGDVFQPLGMGGRRKKLQDLFTDIKLPRRERERVPVLVAPEGILWIVGYRVDHRFAASPETKRVLVAEWRATRAE